MCRFIIAKPRNIIEFDNSATSEEPLHTSVSRNIIEFHNSTTSYEPIHNSENKKCSQA